MCSTVVSRAAFLFAALGAVACLDEGAADSMAAAGPPVVSTATPRAIITTNLAGPRDLDFNPRVPGQLWVVSRDNSVVIAHGATDPDTMTIERRRDRNHAHFMANPSSIAFGADDTNPNAPNAALTLGTFATCQESRNGVDPMGTGNDFMGPVLWPSDLTVFAVRNGELGSHLDMLHQSPRCMGIAWEGAGHVFWAYNGLAGSIDRYDFRLDHGVGNDDHTDGTVHRFAAGKLGYLPRVPSHVVFDRQQGALYIADTANSRVLRLTVAGAHEVGPIRPKQDEAASAVMAGETLVEVVAATSGLVKRPSGIALKDGQLYVSDNATAEILRFRLDGTLTMRMPTGVGEGALAGVTFGPDARLYFVDMNANRVLRYDEPL